MGALQCAPPGRMCEWRRLPSCVCLVQQRQTAISTTLWDWSARGIRFSPPFSLFSPSLSTLHSTRLSQGHCKRKREEWLTCLTQSHSQQLSHAAPLNPPTLISDLAVPIDQPRHGRRRRTDQTQNSWTSGRQATRNTQQTINAGRTQSGHSPAVQHSASRTAASDHMQSQLLELARLIGELLTSDAVSVLRLVCLQ